ncbi:PIN domain-containing protein [Neobacillus mesonae]|nr:PIN domain-containing protein [Neobacillus mesonae]
MMFRVPDFGVDYFPIEGVDSLLIDSNAIIAYLLPSEDFHFACKCFITYLIKNDVELKISSATVNEVLHITSKVLYIDYFITEKLHSGEIQIEEVRQESNRLYDQWSRMQKSDDPSMRGLIGHFNEMAVLKFRPFYEICTLIPVDESIVQSAFSVFSEIPLGSSDAIIYSTALASASGLVTVDKDFKHVMDRTHLNIYYSSTKNRHFQYEHMVDKLDIRDVVDYFDELGEYYAQ